MAVQRKQFPFSEFEPKWQTRWIEEGAFKAPNPGQPGFDASKPKYYVLDMFPYPSGEGLHVGHVEGYTATDIIARFKRMSGFNVLHPMGWDAFGLPAEQFAIKTGQHPRITTERNVNRFRAQLQEIGFSYDWDREISTTDPKYFRWTQWIFLKLYNSWYNPESKKAEPIETYTGENPDEVRLAYVSEMPVNWCPALGTVLANEEVIDGKSEVGGFPVERRPLRQWILRITAFAERLIDELDGLNWPQGIKLLQRNWIGRSEGAQVTFMVADSAQPIEVFTTRPDTLFGATYMVLAPEHALVPEITTEAQREAIEAYQKQVISKSDLERTELAKEKTGVFTGAYAINPVNGEKIPIWIADYVLTGYGTGAIMAVPAHDERDWEFAKKFELPIRQVVIEEAQEGRTGVPPVSSPFFSEVDALDIHEKNLPHWEQDGKLYFVTWRLADSLPADLLTSWEAEVAAWKAAHPEPWGPAEKKEYHQAFSDRIHEWLDRGTGACLLKDDVLAEVIANALRHFDGERYVLEAFVVMPNHVHVMVRLKEGESLADVIHSWKSFTAHAINRALGNEGAVWQSEYFDTIVRNETQKFAIRDYVLKNAKSVGLCGDHRVWLAVETGGTPVLPSKPFGGDGIAINSEPINGLTTPEAKKKIIAWLEEKGLGRGTINYKLRDWLFSRQRYWGEPFPILWEDGKHRALPDAELPLIQPEMEDFKPTGSTEGPLSKATEWVQYSEKATRETNTMPQWAGSCWYYLRFCDPENAEAFVGSEAEKYWMNPAQHGGVDLYVGGTEHAVLHLLYARFWHKVLFDLGYVSTPEPFQRLVNQGMILGPDSQKMSKSRGNVVTPDSVISEYGADSLRLYEMFMGPLEQMKPWSTKGVEGVYRFLGRVWRMAFEETQEGDWEINKDLVEAELTPTQLRVLHATIKKVTEDAEGFAFNTAISQMMVCTNEFVNATPRPVEAVRTLLKLLSPFAPHFADEVWEKLSAKFPGFEGRASAQDWPKYEEKFLVVDEVEYVVQVNGKLRDRVIVGKTATDAEVQELALAAEKVKEATAGLNVVKVIVVKHKLVNIVAR